jgi:hypothetical protein
MRLLFLTAMLLPFSGLRAQHIEDPWARYTLGTLAAIVKRESATILEEPSQVQSIVVSAETYPTRATVVYTGQTRALSVDHRRVLVGWMRSFLRDTALAAQYSREILVREKRHEWWLPVQDVTLAAIRREAKSGRTIVLFTQWMGALVRNERIDWVFAVMTMES